MIFDEVDQGVGGAVADAVGLRLQAAGRRAQVLVVTHSPQVAARGRRPLAGAPRRRRRAACAPRSNALSTAEREEEIARMLAGAEVTDAARAAARALMQA